MFSHRSLCEMFTFKAPIEREIDRRRGGSGIKSSSSERKTDKAASVLHFRTPRNDLIDW